LIFFGFWFCLWFWSFCLCWFCLCLFVDEWWMSWFWFCLLNELIQIYNVRVLILFVSFYLEPWLCYLCWFWQFELILELLFDNLSSIWVDFGRVVLIGLFLLNITFLSAFC
jgi:hypothetical protein